MKLIKVSKHFSYSHHLLCAIFEWLIDLACLSWRWTYHLKTLYACFSIHDIA